MGVERQHTLAFIALLTLLLTATTVAAFPSSTSQVQDGLAINGCAVQTLNGLLQDRDCDGVPDQQDNCVATPNADQSDSNRNSIGDACDLLVTQINLEPGTQVAQGQFFTVNVQLINNKAYEVDDVQARIRNTGLDIDVSTLIPRLMPGEQHTVQFVLKAPGCATPGRYDLTFTTDHAEDAKRYTQTTYQRINVVEREGACHQGATVLDNTLLDTITQQEAEPGERVLYPITIINLNGEAKTYTVSLAPINDLGTYRIDPSPTFTIPAGKRHTLYLAVETEQFAQPGRHTLTLNVESEGVQTSTTMVLRIIKSARAPIAKVITSAVQLALVLLVLALIIGAGIIAYKKLNEEYDEQRHDGKRKRSEAVETVDDEDFESYY